MPRRWKLVSQGEPLDFKVLQVREAFLRHPKDGSLHPRVRIHAGDWVNVVAFTDDDQAILVRQFRCGVLEDTLEIPGGMVDPGETAEVAAGRELEEETGFRAKKLVALGSCHPNPALFDNRTHTFLATGCKRVHQGRPEHGEDLVVELVPRASLPELVKQGAITHALVLVGLFYEQLCRDDRAPRALARPRRVGYRPKPKTPASR